MMYLGKYSLFLPTAILIINHLVNPEKGEVKYVLLSPFHPLESQ